MTRSMTRLGWYFAGAHGDICGADGGHRVEPDTPMRQIGQAVKRCMDHSAALVDWDGLNALRKEREVQSAPVATAASRAGAFDDLADIGERIRRLYGTGPRPHAEVADPNEREITR